MFTGRPEHKQWKKHLLDERSHLTPQTGATGSAVGGYKRTALCFHIRLQLNDLIRLNQLYMFGEVWSTENKLLLTSRFVTFSNLTPGFSQTQRSEDIFPLHQKRIKKHKTACFMQLVYPSVNLDGVQHHSLWWY